jgi:dihydropteroate synthase/2-amino-4-hydroxy-6-hydroxymethyldihydropteridine diphosphokinase
MSKSLYLSLGSNLGHRLDNLRQAVVALGEVMTVEAVSPVYETMPWGKRDQPDFLNICLRGRTSLEPRPLLQAIKTIEQELGRQPAERWGPRLIDIDILFYNRQVIQDETLTIPHPSLTERAFVLAPLTDIAPDFVHPQSNKTIVAHLAALGSSTVCRLTEPLFGNSQIPTPKSQNVSPKSPIANRQSPISNLQSPFAWGERTYIMGILNATPDSFSGDGVLGEGDWITAAVQQAQAFTQAGVDIIDVGGESTRPGSTPVTSDEELARVIPVIQAMRQVLDVPISVDTYRAAVAEAALAAGANWVNDVWGLRMDADMAPLVARAGCPLVIMHNRSKPKNVEQAEKLGGRYVGIEYDDLIADVRRELQETVDLALAASIRPEQIILDPGIGFGKTVEQNIQLINELHQFKVLGYPLLVGTSRKSFIGYTLELPPDERVEGTAATVAIAIDRGADIIRVHDVAAMVRVARMTDRIVRGQ